MHIFLKYIRTTDEQSRIVLSAFVILLSFVLTSLCTESIAWLIFGHSLAEPDTLATSPGVFTLVQIGQSVGLYYIPGILLSWLYSGSVWQWTRLNCLPTWQTAILYLAGFALLVPCIPLLTAFNTRLIEYLPFETIRWLQALEEPSNRMIETLLHDNLPGQFMRNILLLALVPALGEEILFRGIIQRHLSQWWRKTFLAVIVTAFLFSTVHLQFYGFLPRLILGFILGYAMEHGKSLWMPIVLHFINNLLVVTLAYLSV